jgi:Bacterial PH domain
MFGGSKPADGVNVEGAVYDKKEQYDQIMPWLLAGEALGFVFDCKGAGTGFVAVTDKRLLFYDKAFLGKRKALTSVPFSRISSVSSVDQGRGLFGATSELVVKTGSEAFEFEFRGGDKAQRAYQLIMSKLI